MYIKSIYIDNFRAFKNFKASFNDHLNVIVGANNVGKTSLLKAIALLSNQEQLNIDDFNKKDLQNNFKTLYLEEPPKIEIEYVFSHTIDETIEKDETLIKLLPFLSIDEIEKADTNKNSYYSITGKLKLIYSLDEKFNDEYRKEMTSICEFNDYIEKFSRFILHYNWIYLNGNSNEEKNKKDVTALFSNIDEISAERSFDEVNKLVNKVINDKIKNNPNSYERNVNSIRTSLKEDIKNLLADYVQDIDEASDENNDIGLRAGNIKITSIIDFNVDNLQDGFKISVKDEMLNTNIPISHNGLGYNNLINIYLYIRLTAKSDNNDSRIVCFEEPEAHLHPAMQYKLFDYIKRRVNDNTYDQQMFVSTHSSNISAVAQLGNMFMLAKRNGEINHLYKLDDIIEKSINSRFSPENVKKEIEKAKEFLTKYLDVTKSDILFANSVIFVEGITEKLLLPKFMGVLGYNHLNDYMSIVSVDSRYFDKFLSMLDEQEIGKKILCVTDKDYDWYKDNASLNDYKIYFNQHYNFVANGFRNNNFIKICTQTLGGSSFEDELFLANYDGATISTKLFDVVFDGHSYLKDIFASNGFDFDKWANISDGRVSNTIKPIYENINKLINKDIVNKDFYIKLFFAQLFATYCAKGKSFVAFDILTNSSLNLTVPTYIAEGVKWIHE